MKLIEVDFDIGDSVYHTYSPNKIYSGVVDSIRITNEYTTYYVSYTHGGSGMVSNYKDGSTKNLFGSLEEAQSECRVRQDKKIEVE